MRSKIWGAISNRNSSSNPRSKKKYKWTFLLDDKQHVLELEFSYFSGKRRLVLDGRVLHESMYRFHYPGCSRLRFSTPLRSRDSLSTSFNKGMLLNCASTTRSSRTYTHTVRFVLLQLEKNRSEFTYENPKPDNFYPTYD